MCTEFPKTAIAFVLSLKLGEIMEFTLKIFTIIIVVFILLPLHVGSKLMEVLFSVRIFDVEFSSDLYVLRSPNSKKVAFGNWSVRMYVCVRCDCQLNI